MKTVKKMFFFTLVTLLLVACTESSDVTIANRSAENQEKVSISQGVWGNIHFLSGNHMPGTVEDSANSSGSNEPVVRQVYIYKTTNFEDVIEVNSSGMFFSDIQTEPMATTLSDESGFYQVDLPIGSYSLFILENEYFYANGFSMDGTIMPFSVFSDEVIELHIDINYEAYY